jgi:hypothetical protein
MIDDKKYTEDGLPIIQPIKRDWPTQTSAPDGAIAVCGVCGLRIMPVMGYVCTRGDCPTGLGPVMCGGAA